MFPSTLVVLLCGAVLITDTTAFPQLITTQNNRITEADGFIFDGPADRPFSKPLNGGRLVERTTARTPTSTNTTPTMTSQPVTDGDRFNTCVNACPVTSEYNPVCGSDNIQYRNPGSLSCATQCGKDVSLARFGRCDGSGVRG